MPHLISVDPGSGYAVMVFILVHPAGYIISNLPYWRCLVQRLCHRPDDLQGMGRVGSSPRHGRTFQKIVENWHTPPKSDIHLVRGVCQVHTPVIGQKEARNSRSTGTKGDN